MLEKDLIQTRGFHNIKQYGKIVGFQLLSLIHISEPTRQVWRSRMPSSA